MGQNKAFWDWVVSLQLEESPRGDFIRDTMKVLNQGGDPNTYIQQMCIEAQREYEKLLKEFQILQPAG